MCASHLFPGNESVENDDCLVRINIANDGPSMGDALATAATASRGGMGKGYLDSADPCPIFSRRRGPRLHSHSLKGWANRRWYPAVSALHSTGTLMFSCGDTPHFHQGQTRTDVLQYIFGSRW